MKIVGTLAAGVFAFAGVEIARRGFTTENFFVAWVGVFMWTFGLGVIAIIRRLNRSGNVRKK